MKKRKWIYIGSFLLVLLLFALFNKSEREIEPSDVNLNDFIPNTRYEELYPWAHVKECFHMVEESIAEQKKCPSCDRSSERLIWIYFTSPPETWRMMCGCAGYLSICPKCRRQVEFITVVMN